MRAQYEEQLGWAVEEGVDFVIAETNDYVGEALIGARGLPGARAAGMVTFASVQPTTTYDGYDYVEACRILADHGATVVGLNCSRGPETMLPLLEAIRAAVDIPVAAQPVPYRTRRRPGLRGARVADGRHLFPIQLEPFQCTRFEMADFAPPGPRHRRRLHRHLLRWRAPPRPRDGRGARPRDAGQPVLPRPRAPSRARDPRGTSGQVMGGWSAGGSSRCWDTRARASNVSS